MTTIVSSTGQVALSSDWRERDGIIAGQRFEIERKDEGQYLLKRQTAPDNQGLVDWLLGCPEKGWFQPVASGSTDSL